MVRVRLSLVAALVACVAACAAQDPGAAPDGWADADPADFDSKADGIASSSPEVLAFVDGAEQRLLVRLPRLTDKKLMSHLAGASARGVDVHAYLVVGQPAHPRSVIAGEQLEAAGVDLVVERTDRLPGFLAIADAAALVARDGGYATVTDADHVGDAASRFAEVIAEDTTGAPPPLGASGTALIAMPDAHVGPIVGLIAAAQSSIDLEIYQLQSPAVVAALVAAQQRGVHVRVMLEPKTVGFHNAAQLDPQLAAAGIDVADTPPEFDTHHNVDHAKFLVLDGAELVFGTGNLSRSGTGGNPATECDNRDFWIRDARPAAVAEARRLFEADWTRQPSTATTFDTLVVTPDNADARVLATIAGAQHRLYVYNQSLNDDGVQQALLDAHARGVDVHVLLGLQPGFGGRAPYNQPALDALTGAGIAAGYLTRHYLHGKVIVADDVAFVGSQNFTRGGLVNNRELGEVVDDPAIVEALARTFLDDEAHPKP